MRNSRAWSRWASLAVVAACLALAPGSSRSLAATTVHGRVLGPSGVTAMSGASVTFYHLATGATYRSEPADATGAYALPGLPEGRYDVAVETDRGLWLVEKPVDLGADTDRTLSFALHEHAYWEGTAAGSPRSTPLGDKFVGMALILESEKKGGAVPAGRGRRIGIGLGVGGGVLALALAGGGNGGGNGEASPFMPPP
ncbi:MAG: carboxypeptidase-like regulatory domain-containing protein [Acidobacteriota bacterium]